MVQFKVGEVYEAHFMRGVEPYSVEIVGRTKCFVTVKTDCGEDRYKVSHIGQVGHENLYLKGKSMIVAGNDLKKEK